MKTRKSATSGADSAVACPVIRPTQGDILVVGIWIAWVSMIEARLWPTGWGILSRPDWLVHHNISNAHHAQDRSDKRPRCDE